MDGRFFVRFALALLLVAGLAAAGAYVYNLGLAQGMARVALTEAPLPGVIPYSAPVLFSFPGFFGMILLVFLFFGLIRVMVWGGHRGWGGRYGAWEGRGSHFEEHAHEVFQGWHRQAHEVQAPDGGKSA